jgi:hypothetical protein
MAAGASQFDYLKWWAVNSTTPGLTWKSVAATAFTADLVKTNWSHSGHNTMLTEGIHKAYRNRINDTGYKICSLLHKGQSTLPNQALLKSLKQLQLHSLSEATLEEENFGPSNIVVDYF